MSTPNIADVQTLLMAASITNFIKAGHSREEALRATQEELGGRLSDGFMRLFNLTWYKFRIQDMAPPCVEKECQDIEERMKRLDRRFEDYEYTLSSRYHEPPRSNHEHHHTPPTPS